MSLGTFPDSAVERLSPHFAVGLLAHQGGWDEILWVLVPITVMVGLLGVATRRVRKNPTSGTTADESDSRDIGAE